MTVALDRDLLWLIGGVLVVLVVASLVGAVLARRATSEGGRATVANLNARVRAWWMMCAVVALALASGRLGAIVLFALVSVLALRELLTLTPTAHGDHRTLVLAFFLVTPLQYWFVWDRWYGMFAIFIPVYVFLLVATRSALAGETERFVERTSAIH